MKRTPYREILWLFIITRLLLVIVTYFGYILFTAANYTSTPVNVAGLLTSWNHWDAANYVRIAQYGYQSRFDLAFFPLFPLMISLIAHVLGSWSYLLAGTLISNGALLAALFVIYQLAADVAGDEVAHRTLLYLCIFPTALFFFAAYNESLFILLTAGAFLAMRRQRWWLVGILGFFAALTRAAGVLLVVPYLYELWLARESVTARLRNIAPALLPLLLIPLGIALYCFYCWKLTGDPIAFATVQYRWSRHLAWPWQGIWQALFELFWNQPFGSFFEAHIVLDLSATLGFIALAAFGWRKVRTSYTLWTALLILMMLLSPSLDQHDSLISNQRLVLEMFPAFITLSMLTIRHPRLHQTLLLLFPTLLATLSVLFVMYKWVV